MIEPRGFSSLTAEGAAMKCLLVCVLLVGVVGCGESEPAIPNRLAEQPSGNPDSGSATDTPRSAEDVARALKEIAQTPEDQSGEHQEEIGIALRKKGAIIATEIS